MIDTTLLIDPQGVDVIADVLALVRATCPGIDPEQLDDVDDRARKLWGGARTRIAKTAARTAGRPKAIADPAALRAAFADGLRADLTTDQVCARHGISRATLYRLMKEGPA